MICCLCGPVHRTPAPFVLDGASLCEVHYGQVLDRANAAANGIWFDTNDRLHVRATVEHGA